MKWTAKILVFALCILLMALPAFAGADFGDFSGDSDYGGSWDSGSDWSSSSWDSDYSSGSYYDEATETDKPLIPDNMVLIGCTNAYTRMHYGVIKDLEANAAVKMFPKTWLSKDPSAQYLLVQSAPLAGLHQVDAFLVATVCA